MRAVVPSILELEYVSQLLQRPLQFVVSEASNIPRSRNVIIDQLRERLPNHNEVWLLWMDSDIEIFPHNASASYCLRDPMGRTEAPWNRGELSDVHGRFGINAPGRTWTFGIALYRRRAVRIARLC